MRVAILSDVHAGGPLLHKGEMRAASHLAERKLPELISYVVNHHQPDALVNLDDLIRSESHHVDINRYKNMLGCFQGLHLPTVHVLGNHELKQMSLDDLEKAWKEAGFDQWCYGSQQIEGFLIIWLGLEYSESGKSCPKLPDEQYQWLKQTLKKTDLPTLIFTHCAIDNQNLNGNFFYEEFNREDPGRFFLENQQDLRQLIHESGVVRGVFQGHLHHFHGKAIDGIPYITCPAMVENICAPNIQDNFPEVYTIVDVDHCKLAIKTYSQSFRFAGIEF